MREPPKLARAGALSVLYVMAVPNEYGAALRARIEPLMTGIGPVEAAAATAHALGMLEHADKTPDLVFSLGSAGSRSLEHGEVYQLASVSYRDMDCSPLGFAKGITPFLEEAAVVPFELRIDGIPAASIASGASIVSGAGYDGIEADMVDMESYAVYRAAKRFGVPMIGLRGITDGKSEVSRFEHWADYLEAVDGKLAAAVDRFVAQAERGGFPIPERRTR